MYNLLARPISKFVQLRLLVHLSKRHYNFTKWYLLSLQCRMHHLLSWTWLVHRVSRAFNFAQFDWNMCFRLWHGQQKNGKCERALHLLFGQLWHMLRWARLLFNLQNRYVYAQQSVFRYLSNEKWILIYTRCKQCLCYSRIKMQIWI